MAYPMYGASARKGLGDDAMDAALNRWLSVAGVPYTGTATTADALNALTALDIQIANGSVDAIWQGLASSDPQIRGIATAYGQRLDDAPVLNAVLAGTIGNPMLQAIGRPPMEQWQPWRNARINDALGAMFILGYGSVGRISDDGLVTWLDGTAWPGGSVFAPTFDASALTKAAQAQAMQQGVNAEQAQTVGTVPTQNQQIAEAAVASAAAQPAAGWRKMVWNGTNGWLAPDGLFYGGNTPWRNYTPGTGTSLNQPQGGGVPSSGEVPESFRPFGGTPSSVIRLLPTNQTGTATPTPPSGSAIAPWMIGGVIAVGIVLAMTRKKKR